MSQRRSQHHQNSNPADFVRGRGAPVWPPSLARRAREVAWRASHHLPRWPWRSQSASESAIKLGHKKDERHHRRIPGSSSLINGCAGQPSRWMGERCRDPISGQMAMLEEARAIGELVKQGWKPKRTIIYCAWDGEEPMLLGSTEWVETHGRSCRSTL